MSGGISVVSRGVSWCLVVSRGVSMVFWWRLDAKKLQVLEHSWKIGSATCARDSSESEARSFFRRRGPQHVQETVARALFHIQRAKIFGLGALLEDEVGKMCTRLLRELDFT